MVTYKNNLGDLLEVGKSLTPSLVIAGTLYLSTAIFGIEFDVNYVVLAILAAVLGEMRLGSIFGEDQTQSPLGASVISQLLVAWSVVIGTLLLIGYAIKISAYFSRRALILWFVMVGVGLIVSRVGFQYLATYLMSRTGVARTVAIAGVSDVSVRLAQEFDSHPELGFRLDGFFEDRCPERLGDCAQNKVLGKLKDLAAYVKRNSISVIFIALPIRHGKRMLDLLDELYDTTVSIYFLPDIFAAELIQSRIQSICGFPAISLCETPLYAHSGLAKRIVDVAGAAMALTLLSPVMLVIAILIRLESPGTVIFRQRRYGMDGAEIVIYKFRTMYVCEDGKKVVQAKRYDARVTPIGAFLRKFSLDELPQFINVIQGRMSLVGPRPHAVAHNEQYRKLIRGYMIRHKVRPGITGLAQVNGCRGETSKLEQMAARVEHDLDYLRNWSLALDFSILLRTVWVVFKNDKVY